MKFYDKVKVKVIAWDWGNWCVSWRREKYVAYWWPDWWDWGKWWSIYFVWDEWETSLLNLHYQKQIKAKKWEHWKWSQQCWENAQDIFIKVPIWTIIKDAKTNEIIWVITKHNQKVLVAKWWRWWFWNMHFATPTRQFPSFAMLGEPWEKKEIEAELQLLWDVTLIWFPSVWKSSIINTLANTKAKVADYPFTTLIPNLWVVKHKNKNFIIIDVPWLIEWASKWKWLWNEFLRHILKSKIWTFVLDISRFEDSFKELKSLKEEIENYIKNQVKQQFFSDENAKITIKYQNTPEWLKLQVYANDKLLFEKYILFLVNKTDLVEDEEIIKEYKKHLQEEIKKLFNCTQEPFFVYVWNKKVFNEYLDKVITLLDKKLNQDSILDEYLIPKEEYLPKPKKEIYIKDITESHLEKLINEGYIDEEEAENIKVWEVYHPTLAYYTWILPWGNKEAELFFYEVMNKEWVSWWLEKNWVFPQDIIKVKSPYPWEEDRYILRWGN